MAHLRQEIGYYYIKPIFKYYINDYICIMKKMQITKHTSEEIAEMLQSKEDYKVALRLVCMLQISKGESSRKAQDLFLLSHNQICIWAKDLTRKGLMD
jgi:hypothetical protein